ncbi:hypothetical protein [Rossellomorea marisflavi]|nr:hypothetical protein [Rossellomorea marisflavi]
MRPFVIGNPAFIAWHDTRDRVDRLLDFILNAASISVDGGRGSLLL